MPEPIKSLFLIRHAHRENSVHSRDNGLSEKGHRQVRRLVKYFRQRFEHEKWDKSDLVFLTSPKVRCMETLTPLAQLVSLQAQPNADLVEQLPSEEFGPYQHRLQEFCRSWIESSTRVTFVCGHGDGLPLMCYHLLGAALDFKKAGIVELVYENGQVYLRQYLATLKPFYG